MIFSILTKVHSKYSFQEPKAKDEHISPEELKKREEALAAAKAWQEAMEKNESKSSNMRIKETVSIIPENSICI